MAKLETYLSISDKAEKFDQVIVITKDQFDEIIKENRTKNKNENFIYRGCAEAKYKLYNSAQRAWNNIEISKFGISYTEFIKTEIKNAKNWQDGLLEKFFNSFGQPAYDISVLSFLQHYGAPTTLLDWTYSIDNALYFATDNLKYADSDNDIDNFFSIYEIDTRNRDFLSLLDILKSTLNNLDRLLDTVPNKKNVSFGRDIGNIEQLTYEFINNFQLVYIPGYKKGGFAFSLKNRPSFNIIYNQQNLNIINQKGLFIFNSSPNKPLEYFFQSERPKEGVTLPYWLPKIKCYNIHKSLYEYVIYHLNFYPSGKKRTPAINKEFIYPQEELIASKSFTHFLNFDYL